MIDNRARNQKMCSNTQEKTLKGLENGREWLEMGLNVRKLVNWFRKWAKKGLEKGTTILENGLKGPQKSTTTLENGLKWVEKTYAHS